MPNDATRTALLASHGRVDDVADAEAFQTPMELALAAKCGQQLRPGATATELFDAYIGHVCPTETTRAGLRRLAAKMDRQLRGALTIAEIRIPEKSAERPFARRTPAHDEHGAIGAIDDVGGHVTHHVGVDRASQEGRAGDDVACDPRRPDAQLGAC